MYISRTFYQAIFSMITSGTVGILNYLFNIYISRNFPATDFGVFNSIMGIILLVQIPFTAIQTGVMLAIGKNINGNNKAFINKMLVKVGRTSLIISSLIVIFSQSLSKITNIPPHLFLPLSIVLFLLMLSTIGKGYLLGIDKIYQVNVINLIETISKFLIGFTAVTFFSNDLSVATLANGIPFVLTIILSLKYLNTKPKSETYTSLAFSDIASLFALLLLINIPITIDLVLVNPSIRAEYAAMTLVGKVVLYSTILLSSFTMSKLSTTADKLKKLKIFLITTFISVSIGLSITLILFLFPDTVIEVMYGGLYSEISQYLWIYGLGIVIYSLDFLTLNYIISHTSKRSIVILLIIIPILYNIISLSLRPENISSLIKIQMYTFCSLLIILGGTVLYISVILNKK